MFNLHLFYHQRRSTISCCPHVIQLYTLKCFFFYHHICSVCRWRQIRRALKSLRDCAQGWDCDGDAHWKIKIKPLRETNVVWLKLNLTLKRLRSVNSRNRFVSCQGCHVLFKCKISVWSVSQHFLYISSYAQP